MDLKNDQNYPKLDLLKKKDKTDINPNKKRLPLALKIILVIFIIFIAIGIFFSYKITSVGKNIFQPENKDSFLTQISHLMLTENRKIKGEEEGRTNIALLGMGGEGHQGALLTDTIIIASIKYNSEKEPEIALISIPRDLAVPFNNTRYVKINSIYAYGEMQNPSDKTYGGKLISDYIKNITGLPIHYYVRVDFEGFKQIVDSIGDIEVEVKNSFYDPMYPTENFGYQKISFKKGLIKMDGDLALKYARSRHGIVIDGEKSEGSDFARAKRQQQILTSLKDKAFSVSTIINPKKTNEILNALGDHVRTNMQPWEILRLAEIGKNIQNEQITNKVIDEESGLVAPTTGKNNAYLLVPKDKNYNEIKEVCKNIFNIEELQQEKEIAKIVVLNGTPIGGIAKENADKLIQEKYNVIDTDNTKISDYEKTVIYDLSKGKMPKMLENLKERFNANISLNDFSLESEKILKNPLKNIDEINFIIILGLDSDI